MRLPAPALLTSALLATLCGAGACGRTERASAEAVRAGRSRLEPGFQPPADGRLNNAQIDMYLRVRRAAAGAGSDAEAARLLRQALALDSTFAMAWRKLAVTIGNQGLDRALEANDKGEQLSAGSSRITMRVPDYLKSAQALAS